MCQTEDFLAVFPTSGLDEEKQTGNLMESTT